MQDRHFPEGYFSEFRMIIRGESLQACRGCWTPGTLVLSPSRVNVTSRLPRGISVRSSTSCNRRPWRHDLHASLRTREFFRASEFAGRYQRWRRELPGMSGVAVFWLEESEEGCRYPG